MISFIDLTFIYTLLTAGHDKVGPMTDINDDKLPILALYNSNYIVDYQRIWLDTLSKDDWHIPLDISKFDNNISLIMYEYIFDAIRLKWP